MSRREITDYLGEDWIQVQELIRTSLQSDIELLNHTNQFTLEHSGKQMRPMLCLLVAKACAPDGQITQDSIRYAAALELLHNATLFHDDVADCSTTRRGVPTAASVLGGPASVLVGDFWLVKAVDTVLESDRHGDNVIRLFSRTLSNLAEGEMLQLQKAANGDTSEADYQRIIYDKTATMFEMACASAAVSVDASEDYRRAVSEYGVKLGIAFQIKDDILDYDGGDIGKPVGLDLAERKITLPLLGALHNVSDEQERSVREMVCQIDDHPEYRERILDFVHANGGIEYAEERLREFSQLAVDALEQLPDSQAKTYLKMLAVYTAERNK